MNTLKNRLKNKIASCYLVEGEDYFLYEKALSMISKAINLQLEDFNKTVFDDDNYSMQAVVNSCEILPMGSEKRLIIIKNVAKVNENDKKILEIYLKNPNLSVVLLILDFYNKFSSVKNLCEFVDARRMDRAVARGVIVNELAKRNKQISTEAVDALLDYGNGYLTCAINELDKLVYYNLDEPLVTKKIVDDLVNKNSEYTVFELTEALGKRDADTALAKLALMEKEPGTLGLITNHFRRLFFIAISPDDNSTLANLLGVKEYAIMKQRQQVKNFSKIQLKKIYSLLEDIDMKIKSGEMLSNTALYYLVFSILFA